MTPKIIKSHIIISIRDTKFFTKSIVTFFNIFFHTYAHRNAERVVKNTTHSVEDSSKVISEK